MLPRPIYNHSSSELKSRLVIKRNSFIHKNGNFSYSLWVLGRKNTYLQKEHSDSNSKYFDDDIIDILEFLVDNVFVLFGGKEVLFQ